jgi:hypothetical protein
VQRTIVQLIGSVRTTKGLFVKATLDTRTYETGISVRDSEKDDLNIVAKYSAVSAPRENVVGLLASDGGRV